MRRPHILLAALLTGLWPAPALGATVAVSASGRMLAFAHDETKRPGVVVRELVTDQFLLKADIGRPAVEVAWADDRRVVVLSRVRAGDPRRVVQVMDVEARSLRLLVAEDRTPLFEAAQARRVGGEAVLFLQGRGPGGLSLYRAALDGSRARLAAAGTPQTVGWVVGADGQPVAEARLDRSRQRWVLRVKAGGVWREVVETAARPEAPRLLGLGGDWQGVLYAVREGAQWTWREARLDGRPPGAPLAVGADDEPILDPVDGRIIGRIVADPNGHTWDFFHEADAQAWRQVATTFPDAQIALLSWDTARRRILAQVTRSGRRVGVALVDLVSREASWIDPP